MQPVQDYEEINKLQGIKTSWSLWELYRMQPGGDFASSLHKLITFKDCKQFCEIFTFLPHGSPSKIFFDKENMEIKKFFSSFFLNRKIFIKIQTDRQGRIQAN
jgi:hypothetical protein